MLSRVLSRTTRQPANDTTAGRDNSNWGLEQQDEAHEVLFKGEAADRLTCDLSRSLGESTLHALAVRACLFLHTVESYNQSVSMISSKIPRLADWNFGQPRPWTFMAVAPPVQSGPRGAESRCVQVRCLAASATT